MTESKAQPMKLEDAVGVILEMLERLEEAVRNEPGSPRLQRELDALAAAARLLRNHLWRMR